MINLNETPEALLTMSAGQTATLDGHEFRLETVTGRSDIYLTLASSPLEIKPTNEWYGNIHVRFNDCSVGFAVMSRSTMIELITTKRYKIA